MNRVLVVVTLLVSLASGWAQTTASLRGTVTDPSGAAVPGAVVRLRGPGGEHHTKTGATGQYAFTSLAAGEYQVRVEARGFTAVLRDVIAIDHAAIIDAQLTIQTETQVVDVEDQVRGVSAEPGANGGALVLRARELAALSDDPDELAMQLQILAGPAPGPDGGQLYIDGFSGGNLPPKSSIREVRINSNPFSPEYDHPGFSRIEVFTKPGSDSIRGQAFLQFNDAVLNSRNPLLTQSSRPPYRTQFYGFNIGGPLKKNKASFTFDAEHRRIGENAFILATTLDSSLNPTQINQALATPQTRTTISPRLDYSINTRNTLAIRVQDLRIALDNQGVGDFNLASRAYNEKQSERILQITETAAISPRTINETRFEYAHSTLRDTGISSAPSIFVQGAFSGGGATVGDSGSVTNSWELSNISTWSMGRHTLKWGGRVRQSLLDDTSRRNFAGTFTFLTLEQYRKTLALQEGGGPWQFSMNAGTPTASVRQADAGLFANEDWRVRPNVALSAGLRYEVQGNRGDLTDWAPRIGIAWGLGGKSNRLAKTVLRVGAGIFYDRIPLALTLNALRYNGALRYSSEGQQSFLIPDPTFFPAIPPASALQASQQPQQLRQVFAGIRAPRMFQSSLGIERQLSKAARLTVTWINTRGLHLLNSRNINAPAGVSYPFGDRSIRLLTESAGFSRLNQVVANTNVNYRRLFLFGYYSLSYGKDNNEGLPADPYNLRAEWGPSSYADMHHRMAMGATIPLPWKLTVNPFLVANSGQPYNITTGLDPYNTGYPAARPALLSGVAAPACTGGSLIYAAGFGCFDLKPAPGVAAIGHNFARGPAAVNVALRLSRTWAFGGEGRSGPMQQSSGGSMHGGGGPPAGMFDTKTGRKYNLTISASTLNALNHPNFAPPNGDLSSPYFGRYRSLGGMIVMMHGGAPSTYNRKIDLQLRFTF